VRVTDDQALATVERIARRRDLPRTFRHDGNPLVRCWDGIHSMGEGPERQFFYLSVCARLDKRTFKVTVWEQHTETLTPLARQLVTELTDSLGAIGRVRR
jgi:hypothetical protein